MTKRQVVEWCYHEGLSADFAYEHMLDRYPEVTLDWIEEVYKEMDNAE